MSADLEADLLVLLEDGPHDTGTLVGWVRQPNARVYHTLLRLARQGALKRVGPSKQWALASYEGDIAMVDDPAIDLPERDDVEEDEAEAVIDDTPAPVRTRAALRQEAPNRNTRGLSWWVDLDRKALSDTAHRRAPEMSRAREARWSNGAVPDC